MGIAISSNWIEIVTKTVWNIEWMVVRDEWKWKMLKRAKMWEECKSQSIFGVHKLLRQSPRVLFIPISRSSIKILIKLLCTNWSYICLALSFLVVLKTFLFICDWFALCYDITLPNKIIYSKFITKSDVVTPSSC